MAQATTKLSRVARARQGGLTPWSIWSGIAGQFGLEWLVSLERNRWSVCSGIRNEYSTVLIELHEKFPRVEVGPILDLIIVNSELCAPARLPRPVCVDPADDKFFACAVSSGVNIIVSGDKHMKAASGYRGITVVSPRGFVDRYLGY